jgi:hypothetical protein
LNRSSEPSELDRALARPDIEDLRADLAQYLTWVQWISSKKSKDDDDGPEVPWSIYRPTDADMCFAMAALAEAEYDDPVFLGHVAVSPLESIFEDLSDERESALRRVEAEAKINPRFRWMLAGMYTPRDAPEWFDERFRAAIGSIQQSDPLPPRVKR